MLEMMVNARSAIILELLKRKMEPAILAGTAFRQESWTSILQRCLNPELNYKLVL